MSVGACIGAAVAVLVVVGGVWIWAGRVGERDEHEDGGP